MKPYKEGKKSKAVCSDCKKVVTTTFETRSVGVGKASNFHSQSLLVAVCDCCNSIVAIPQQSVLDIKKNKKVFNSVTRKLRK